MDCPIRWREEVTYDRFSPLGIYGPWNRCLNIWGSDLGLRVGLTGLDCMRAGRVGGAHSAKVHGIARTELDKGPRKRDSFRTINQLSRSMGNRFKPP